MSNVDGKVIIITGASSGLGEATAKMLAERGAKLVLAARREERLQELVNTITENGGTAVYKTVDVTKRDEVKAVADYAIENFSRIDVLINNAGLMPLAPLDELKVDEWDQMIDVNIKGVMYGVSAVLPTMRKQESGHIINLSSVAGHVVFPGATVYCATKFAVKAISEGIRQESNGQIRATNISPGAVSTELTDHISHEDSKQMADELYNDAIDASAIARSITFAIEQPHDVDINEMIVRPIKQEL
jgi:NADP-dependent 3-hydroxy acid dehydrogenase YdfG